MNFKQEIKIGTSLIGKDNPVYIVAEIGINHNGDMDLAREMIKSAKTAGVDAVKFQNYRTEDFISDKTLTFEYLLNGKKTIESQFEVFKRCELSQDDLIELINYCKEIDIDIHSTPTNEDGIRLLAELGISVLKNGSDYLTNLPLVRAMGETNLPTVLSTGMATIAEISQAVQVFGETENNNLILLHCTSSYPTPAKDVNLARIKTLSSAFGIPTGFSDHSAGTTAAIGATILGSCWIEKHFTLDRKLPGPDQWFSMDFNELKFLVNSVRDAEQMVGSANIYPTASEELGRRDFRLSCVAQRNIEKGSVIDKSDVAFRRPGYGVPPVDIQCILGRKTKASIVAGSIFSYEMFE